MDELDRDILRELREDARISFREIALKTNVSSQTVSDRIQKLMEKGVIKGFTVVIDQNAAGYPITFTVELDVDVRNMKQILNSLCEYPELYQISVITGDHDILALGVARDITHLYEIIEEKISNIEGVKATKTSISLRTVKEVPKCVG
ncbi:MAG: Lrp/AsnC family transcriptional regulator [Theionarchaea archaeon]|nr:Lrp/AsnC family transcriptional regulator [Theionarchaea archaeon]MBU7001110.1 Lrp/AsnC family transcriptional regulator [Theionarchaea archaeon]MBU7020599.1 Lrp/AsnC family transcriptional regulator [Theionarchaea archaeon]MBU7034248.1 Lrp/AsnC family transcriptional regulator [Theionarchaea archaeon]MBU7039322.1 Lrp/AsnC family transcriptional regulator [Theionarchaea archaeon]